MRLHEIAMLRRFRYPFMGYGRYPLVRVRILQIVLFYELLFCSAVSRTAEQNILYT